MSLARIFPELKTISRLEGFQDPFFQQKMPAMDLIETSDAFVVKADVPGYSKEQIEIDAQGQQLVIRGKHIEQKEQKDEHHHTKERCQSSFSRTVTLPLEINPQDIKAGLRDGVLEIQVPKSTPKTSRIPIQ